SWERTTLAVWGSGVQVPYTPPRNRNFDTIRVRIAVFVFLIYLFMVLMFEQITLFIVFGSD
ncbi:MAG: hypothetical protein J1E05_07660, partial [Eubacterium sp.]|nr:hypothetical protein [Eubacterium sp.]